MEWLFTLDDAWQLLIPWACFLLVNGVVLAYLTLYIHFRQRLYLSGLGISLVSLVYIFFEGMVVLSGWAEWPNAGPVFHRIGQLSSIWFTPALMFFAWTFLDQYPRLRKTVKWFFYISAGISLLMLIAAFILPDSFISTRIDTERLILSPGDFYRGVTGPLYMVRDLVLGLFMLLFTILAVFRMIKAKKENRDYIILVALFFVFWGAVDDMIFYQTGKNFFLNSIRFSRVSVGITLMVFLFLISLLREFLNTQRNLRKSYDMLNTSEEKYRLLSEGVDQAIFSLNSRLEIQSYNNRAGQLFRLFTNKENHLLTLLKVQNHEGSYYTEDLLMEKVDELKVKKHTSFNIIIKDPQTEEPEEYSFQLNALEGEFQEYIGRATRINYNRLSHYLEYEKLRLSIDNYLVVIDDVSTRLTHALGKYMDTASVLQVKMGLQEMIINAIEHGNLGISFEEKSAELEKGDYREFLKERQKQSPYNERMVSIEYVLTEEEVKYLISDEGEGFDYHKTLKKVKERVDKEMLPHGRGIRMSEVIFDKVKYNKKGNQVLLEKRLKQLFGA